MLNFPEQPKSYSSVFLEETGKPLPQKIDPRMRYALFSTIAKGGKSLIKSCKDLHLSRFVCYKTLKPEFASDEREQQRLIREARVSAMLQHPNTVPTYELGRDARGNPYFTMKLLHGYTLREILDYRERYDLTQLVEVVLQIGHALEYAHTHGVAHRDIKPENILAGPYGEVLLMDWGLAKVWHPDGSSAPDEERKRSKIMDLSLTSQGKVQGTPHYMSPEQINQDTAIDHRTDIYSLGVVLYEILCGETPSKGEKLHHIIQSTLNDIPVPPAQLTNQRVPKALEEIALRCLQKQPSDRYASIAELLHLLQGNWRTDLPRAAKAPATKREEL
ncbi:MAG: serine/threonine protein kinase [Pseudomonadales bacterium]|nr:serine/threonine protein kinase [Pseudomonadales bacterium]